MASGGKKGAAYRLRKELAAMHKEKPEFIWATHKESNILLWSFLLAPPSDSVYGGGWYWGRLTFPAGYPFAPPSIIMCTPSGRFQVDHKICMSMSDYHPESWNPSWSVSTILKGVLSFMLGDEVTTGAVEASAGDLKRARAQAGKLVRRRERAAARKALAAAACVLATPAYAETEIEAREIVNEVIQEPVNDIIANPALVWKVGDRGKTCSLARVGRVFPGPFVNYLSRFLLAYDDGSRALWRAESAEIPLSWNEGKVRRKRATQLAAFASSVERGLCSYAEKSTTEDGQLNTTPQLGVRQLLSLLRSRYGLSLIHI